MASSAKLTLLLTLALSCLGPLYGAERESGSSQFRTSTGMVLVPVTVTDHNGKTVNGLQRDNFTIFDEHNAEPIVSFAGDDTPCSVGLVLDTSGSMRGVLGDAKDTTHAFFKNANPEDEFLLLTVSTKPESVSGFTTDVAELEKDVQFTSAGGMTALVDTVYLSLNRMRSAKSPRRALLVISDGLDNYSRYSKSELLRVALEADVQIYSVIVNSGGDGGGPSAGIPFRPSMVGKPIDMARQSQEKYFLEELSEKTGGLHFRAGNAGEAQDAVLKAGRAIRNVYVIGYRAPESDASGKWHHIHVKADVPHTSVSARSGYYAR
jgi:Ca-activated chloride channel family protein